MRNSNTNAYSKLLNLHKQYCPNSNHNYFNDWIKAIRNHSDISRKTLVDIAVDAANISHTITNNPEAITNPLIISAIKDTVPTFDFNNPPTGAALEGALNAAKGKYFEYLVVDRLNSGQRVGDVVLPESYTAKLADSANQPGWDLQILDHNFHPSEYLQLKATDSTAYIREALERYPDVTILATEEVANPDIRNSLILDSNISDSELEETVRSTMDLHSSSIDESFFDAFNPLLSLAFIVGTEGLKLSLNKHDIDRTALSVSHRITRTLASQSIGALVYAIGGGWLAIPATVISGFMYEQMAKLYETNVIMNSAKETLILLRLQQQEKYL